MSGTERSGDGWGQGGNGGAPMPTAKECRQHAEECLQLAKQAEEFYVRAALIELAAEFKKQAEKLK
jgi:HEPN domain-containing protein